MVYDAAAKKLAVKIIGTVESNLAYTAVNYNDPITVGIAQWYGTRAAGVLNRMRTTNTASWYGVAASINNQLATIPATDAYWNSRRLTLEEGQSLVGVLGRNQVIQNNQLTDDLDGYLPTAAAQGIDKDTETDVLLYFFSLYHQGGTLAYGVIDWSSNPTLEAVHAATLAHATFGKYGQRYNTTYNLIDTANVDGVDPTPDPPAPDPEPVNGNAKYISVVGDTLMVKFKDQERITYVPDGRGNYIPRKGALPPIVPPPTQPDVPPENSTTGDWVHPLPGSTMTSGYGPRAFDGLNTFHYGVDFANPAGSPGNVLAPTKLVITRAYNVGDPGANATAGGYVKGHTPDGKWTFNFYHLAPGSVSVSAGSTVNAGTVLGVEGATGNVTGQHLHFEAYEGNHADPWPPPYGITLDPLPILRAYGVNV